MCHGVVEDRMDFKFLHELIVPANTKIVMLVMDGLGGLPLEPGGKTELETARTPNLDSLAEKSALGLTDAARTGHHGRERTGSPGHRSDMTRSNTEIGRGVLEAVGVGLRP